MKIIRHQDLQRDMKVLGKKYPTPEESLESWEMLFEIKGLEEMSGLERYPGFGKNIIYKARVIPKKENVGKSSGYRVIFQIKDGSCVILFFYRHTIQKKETKIGKFIGHRIATF